MKDLEQIEKEVVEKDTSGLSNILFALRTEKGVDNKSAYERQMCRKPNTLKSAMIRKCFLEKDPQLQIEPEDFSEEADSTILVRERVKGTKLEGNFKKVKGQIVSQSENTITILPKSGKQTIYSKRDVAKMGQDANANKNETYKRSQKPKKNQQSQYNHFGGHRQAAQKWDNPQKRHKEKNKQIGKSPHAK